MYLRLAILPGVVLAIALLAAPVVQGSGPAAPLAQAPLGTAFTYQGRLLQGGAPANGNFGMTFKLFDFSASSTQVGPTLTQSVLVTNGLFTVQLDFGEGAFDGHGRWLELAVNGTTLTPRQPLTPVPYALALPGLRTQGSDRGSPNVLGGSIGNSVTSGVGFATIGGGGPNRVTNNYGTVGGGRNNQAGDNISTPDFRTDATVGGGHSNTASGNWATVGGGLLNMAPSQGASVSGGESNHANGLYATVAGGQLNTAAGGYATVPGGASNAAGGDYATVAGGRLNTALGNFSFAAGRRAIANQDSAFVWADSTEADFTSDALGANSFSVRASGGARFVNGAGTGVLLAAGGNAWAPTSDRAAKEHFAPVDVRGILQRLVSVPIETWNLKSQDPAIRHIGPMAQDFAAAFAVGEDDTHISTVDADGVAFAAIQGLYQLIQDQDAALADGQDQFTAQREQLAAQDTEIAALKGTVAALEARLAVLEQAASQ